VGSSVTRRNFLEGQTNPNRRAGPHCPKFLHIAPPRLHAIQNSSSWTTENILGKKLGLDLISSERVHGMQIFDIAILTLKRLTKSYTNFGVIVHQHHTTVNTRFLMPWTAALCMEEYTPLTVVILVGLYTVTGHGDIQWLTTLSLTIRVYLYSLSSCWLPLKSAKSPDFLRKFELRAIQGNLMSSILVSIENAY